MIYVDEAGLLISIALFILALFLIAFLIVLIISTVVHHDYYREAVNDFKEREREKRFKYGEYMYEKGYQCCRKELFHEETNETEEESQKNCSMPIEDLQGKC